MASLHLDPGLSSSGPARPRAKDAVRTEPGQKFLREIAGTRRRQDGCAAAAYAALYANVDVITGYPVWPGTAILTDLARFVADGLLDAEYRPAGGGPATFGADSRVFSGSSGPGVTHGYETYAAISGARIPVQMAVADRRADPAAEHPNALCARDMGWLMGWVATPQEAFDRSLLGYAIGEDPRVLLPQMLVQDGASAVCEVEMPSIEQVDAFLARPRFRPEQGPPRPRERVRAMEDAVPVIREKTAEFARVFGRGYPAFVESYLLDDAEIALVVAGGQSVTCRAAVSRLRAAGIKIGMARLLWLRPFPAEDLREALRGVLAVGVVETGLGPGGASGGGVLSLDVTTALYHMTGPRPLVTSFLAGLGAAAVPVTEFDWMAGHLGQAVARGRADSPAHWAGPEGCPGD
jgi:pyruvate ferredoxin oxidoreductase alpha subunit/oxalate oxidoreductase subunit alpha